ncbi:hypothetical protein JX266_006020 [Neoarthrinium moseri]|nr:hypothetical protein JX266_006020 [Neoarthrinium moseri]
MLFEGPLPSCLTLQGSLRAFHLDNEPALNASHYQKPCVRRGEGASCNYQKFAGDPGIRQEQSAETQARLRHLEQLVQSLASQPLGHASRPPGTSAGSPPAPPQTYQPSPQDGTNMTNDFVYSGSTHWSAMLEDIQELRMTLPIEDDHTDDLSTEGLDGAGVDIIFGSTPSLPLEHVLARFLPQRTEVDRMVSAYFRAQAVAAPFIHATQFRRFYQQFWENPLHAPPLWISILFSVCHIAASTLRPSTTEEVEKIRFSVAAAHCLAIGQYFRPRRFAIESLLLFAQAECLTTTALSSDIGAILGLLVRLATSMGYHRDPEPLLISPFEKEMRRRLPSGVQFPTWDTKIPRVLQDSDFDETSTELPPSRPELEGSHLIFYNTKHKFMVVFEKILRHTLSTQPNESEVTALDSEMRAEYAVLPEFLRPRPMSDSVVDPANLIVTRLCVSFLYYKCLCVLHRPYVILQRKESIMVCYDASSSLVRDFVDAYYEFKPGGQAETERWFLSSITWHDFLFGMMALCLVVCTTSHESAASITDIDTTLALLTRARDLCIEQESNRHKDTRRVISLVEAMIYRFGTANSLPVGLSTAASSAQSAWPMEADESTAYAALWDGTENGEEALTGLAQDPSWDYFGQFLELDMTSNLS